MNDGWGQWIDVAGRTTDYNRHRDDGDDWSWYRKGFVGGFESIHEVHDDPLMLWL